MFAASVGQVLIACAFGQQLQDEAEGEDEESYVILFDYKITLFFQAHVFKNSLQDGLAENGKGQQAYSPPADDGQPEKGEYKSWRNVRVESGFVRSVGFIHIS